MFNSLKFSKFALLFLIGGIVTSSCNEDEPTPTYTIPTTYNFDNVSYSGQTQRLAMLTELKSYMSTANTIGTTVDATRLKAMYANDATNAQFAGTYDASKQLKSKTFEQEQAVFEALMEAMAMASQATSAGSNGQAGVVTSPDGEKNYLLSANGLEYTQVIEKGLMAACFYYQATSIYFGDGKMNVDNETITPGEGTDMEHHWDEAFGYLGVPIDFPTNADGLAFWGKYCNSRDAILGSNAAIMNGFLKGRAAISNDDLTARDEAIATVRDNWELVTVGTALHYINSAISNIEDDARRSHALSEAAAFIYAIKFNPTKKITNTQVDELLTTIGGSADFLSMNFYNTTVANLNTAKEQLAGFYDLTAQKDDF